MGWWRLDESSGTATVDSIGNSSDGTLTNGAVVNSAGVYNSGVKFDGSNDYITVPYNSALNITTDFTVSAWIKRSATSNYGGIVAKTNGTAYDYDFYVDVGTAGCADNQLGFYSDSAGWACSTGTVADTTAWHHVVATRSGTTITFYIDGVASGSMTYAAALSTGSNPLEIGRDGAWGAPANFSGSVDDVRVYNRSLTDYEIYDQYLAGK
jgi:hypothetical protein